MAPAIANVRSAVLTKCFMRTWYPRCARRIPGLHHVRNATRRPRRFPGRLVKASVRASRGTDWPFASAKWGRVSSRPEAASSAPVVPLPSGTVTFAFTDIEGSTRRWEEHPAAMQDAVRRHDAVMRAAIVARCGHVFKTIGDAFCAAFSRPPDALAAMIDAQRALAAQDFSAVGGLRVRAALHTGTTDERNGDYFGSVVNRVARLLSIANGGQVVVSGVTAELVAGLLPPQTSLLDLGAHRLKDLSRPEHVYQLVAPDLAAAFAPLRSLGALPNNLPLTVTSFIGREREVAAVADLLAQHRLVTLVGSGGIGKTRSSLQVAANLLERFVDGAWFIELAPLARGDYIPWTVAEALGITLASEGEPIALLTRELQSKTALLVFDNCEHLVEPAARVIAALLRACPQLEILASSRQALGISGEMTYRMPSLALPSSAEIGHPSGSDASRYAAVSLFIERARAVDNRLALTDENVATIAEICRRLDGIPLAIELAAARTNVLSPRQLRDRLDERFRVLTAGSRDVLPRQQTLRALIDWSHDLLDEHERSLFRRLGIFANGFALEGAVAVGSGLDLDEFELFDVLASLVDKSLVLAESTDDVRRYRLLESTRVYAREKLVAAGERDDAAGRHLRYLRDVFVAEEERYERTGLRDELNARFTAELDDVRAALDYAVTSVEAASGAELLAATSSLWEAHGLDGAGIARCEAFLAVLPAENARVIARLWTTVSRIVRNFGHATRSYESAIKAVGYARASGDPATLASALGRYSDSAAGVAKYDEAQASLGEAEAIAIPSQPLRRRLLAHRAFLSFRSGDLAAAAHAYEELRAQMLATGNSAAQRIALLSLAEIEHARGRTPRAVELAREALAAFPAHADRSTTAMLQANLAAYLAAVGDGANGRDAARAALRELATTETDSPLALAAMEHLALCLVLGASGAPDAHSARLARGATLAGYTDAAFHSRGLDREFTEQTTRDRLDALLRECLTPDDRARLFTAAAALSAESALELAFAPDASSP
jgi:predicted ATPase/class 3 adenylate cyclase